MVTHMELESGPDIHKQSNGTIYRPYCGDEYKATGMTIDSPTSSLPDDLLVRSKTGTTNNNGLTTSLEPLRVRDAVVSPKLPSNLRRSRRGTTITERSPVQQRTEFSDKERAGTEIPCLNDMEEYVQCIKT